MEDDITLAFNKIRVNVQQRWVHCTVYNAYTEQYTMRTLSSIQCVHCTVCNEYAVSSVQYPQEVSLQFFETE